MRNDNNEPLELDARKRLVLKAVVDDFINTGQPVGSAHLAHTAGIDVSPATIRSEMAYLEAEGFLTHPHTSAGRLPTDKGYRFFVDHFVKEDSQHKKSVINLMKNLLTAHSFLEEMIEESSKCLADLSQLVAIVVGAIPSMASIKAIDLVRIELSKVLFIVVFSPGDVEKAELAIDPQTADESIESVNNLVRKTFRSVRLDEIDSLKLPLLKEREENDLLKLVVDALDKIRSTANNFANARNHVRVHVDGISYLSKALSAIDSVHEVIELLDDEITLVNWVNELVGRNEVVSIGSENKLEPLCSCSVVVLPCVIGGSTVGTVSLLGPTRMQYEKALAAVAAVKEQLESYIANSI